jgi:hypothetical protein
MFASLYVCLATSSSPFIPDLALVSLYFSFSSAALTLTAYVLWFRNSSGCFAYVMSSLTYSSMSFLIGSMALVIQFFEFRQLRRLTDGRDTYTSDLFQHNTF